MAKIAKSAWLNPLFRRYCTKRYYEIPPTNKFTEARQLLNHHKMMKNGEYYYEGVRGGKQDIPMHPETRLSPTANGEI